MTFNEIRTYASVMAERYARLTAEGRGAEAIAIEDAVIEKIGTVLGGALHPERKQQYLAKMFTLQCESRDVVTRVVHLTKHGRVTCST